MKSKFCYLPIFCLLSFSVAAQPGPTNNDNRRVGYALRTAAPPRIDGDLSDPCWLSATPMTDFTSFSPVFGKPASEKTEVRVLYTDEAIYVGAYLYMRDASKIRTDLSRRDAGASADQFHVGFDTYRDRQNAFRFEVSAAGVQRDIRMSPENFDTGWDAVWDSEVRLNSDGWAAELRIPFSALRFSKSAEQVWGLQFARMVQYDNEFSTWSPVAPNGGGAMPQWGDLAGFKNINPPLRISLSPYLAASYQHSPLNDSGDFSNSRSVSGGLDLKWGLSESFTLDATLIPNFGEVQSDNLIRNLSPFEVQYEERRQFFTEGAELFGKGGLFYSRRIGGRPEKFFSALGAYDEETETLVKNPTQTPLYNATKFSGRTRTKLGVGVLNAVAAPTFAEVRNNATGALREVQTGALTNYNVLVFDQALRNNSAVSFVNTSVVRNGAGRDAAVSALNFNFRDKANVYEIAGGARLSQILQNGAQRGGGYNLSLGKVSGLWGGFVGHELLDDRYDQRDMGLFQRNNYSKFTAKVQYQNYTQQRNIGSVYAELTGQNTWLYEPSLWESFELIGYAEIGTLQRQSFFAEFFSRPLWYYDYYEPRVWGKKFYHAPFAFISPGFITNPGKRFYTRIQLQLGESPIPNDAYVGLSLGPVWAVNTHLRLTASLYCSKDHSNFGAVNWQNPDDIIFGRRNITTFDNSVTAEYLFSPKMNASFRVRHYWNKLYYRQYLHLNEDGTFALSDWSGSADENFNQFNIDFVYTWQFAPGSFLTLIWKDAVFVSDGLRGDNFFRNLGKTFDAPQDNTFTIKAIYWLDGGRWFN